MDEKELIQVEIYGLSLSSSISGGGYAIILKEVEGERRLPIIIGQFEAQAIAIQLEGIVSPRPLTHDLIKNLVEHFGYSIEYVLINEIKDSTFYARIKFDSDEIEDMDSRPSDAIAIALKFQAPIFVSRGIMDEVGFIPEAEQETSSSQEPQKNEPEPEAEKSTTETKRDRLEELKKDLEDAIAKEEYEKAALIRDEIKKLDISNIN
ncbi:MAG TPA: DUF151 domain-containing protein [Ignavibacteria bacterium]|nr:DUF151 domain-containing protein [Ignavibacteria bacterium]